MSKFMQFVKHPIATAFPKSVQKKQNENPDPRRSFLKTSLAALVSIPLLTRCSPDITGPYSEGYTTVNVNGKKELTAPVGTAVTADEVTFVVKSITTPDFASEPREAVIEILNSDNTAAYTTRMRKGEVAGEFYSPQDAAKTNVYKLECVEIPTPAPNPDWAKFTLWKKKA